MPKYVVSSTLIDAAWTNSTVTGRDLATEISALPERYGTLKPANTQAAGDAVILTLRPAG